VLEVTFKTCTAAIFGHPKNRKFFREQIVGTLSTGLRSPHFLYSRHLTKVLESLLDLATENVAAGDSELTEETLLYNPDVVLVILDLLSQSPEDLQEDFIRRLNLLVKSNKKNQDALSKMGAVGFLLKHFSTKLRCGGDDVLQQDLLSLLGSICTYRISGSELRQFLRLLAPDGLDSTVPEHIVSSLLNISKADRSPPHIIFDMRKTGYACMHIPTLGDRAWPPTNGFSFLFWLYIDNLGVGADGNLSPCFYF
jgi:hypothetical protein